MTMEHCIVINLHLLGVITVGGGNKYELEIARSERVNNERKVTWKTRPSCLFRGIWNDQNRRMSHNSENDVESIIRFFPPLVICGMRKSTMLYG